MVSLSENVLLESMQAPEAGMWLRSFNGYAPEFANESQRLWPLTIQPRNASEKGESS